jgi:ABC-2 type transport system permease protein
MKRTLSVAKRVILQILKDRRTLGLIMVAPILMVTLLWVVVNSGATTPTIAVYDVSDSAIVRLEKYAKVRESQSLEAAKAAVESQEADAAYYFEDGKDNPQLLVDGADPSITAIVVRAFQQAQMEALESADNPLAARLAPLIKKAKPEVAFLHGATGGKPFDYLAPVMMGFIIFFFIFILSGISFLRERTTGTLERMLVSPAKRFEIVSGYMLGFGFFALIQTVLVQAFIIWVLGVPMQGGFVEILVINAALCLVALSMGGFVSAFAQNEFQVFQFIPIVIVPQILFSGILDLREASQWVQWLSQVFPLTYAGQALRQVMLRGRTLLDVLPQLCVVLAFALAFMGLNSLALRKRN